MKVPMTRKIAGAITRENAMAPLDMGSLDDSAASVEPRQAETKQALDVEAEALGNVLRRMEAEDLDAIVKRLGIKVHAGGSWADACDALGRALLSHHEARRKAKSLTAKRATAIAVRRISTQTDRQINENLGQFCGSFAEAYRVGIEEAQRAIVARFAALQ